MRKYIKLILGAVLLINTIASCTKDAKSKDYTASIKGKTWWGMLTYTGKTAEYYSVHFNDDNSLLWSQLQSPGDYGGQWILDGKHLTISFTGNSMKIQADISNDDKLENIADNTGNSEINSGELIANPKLSLENTVWKGTWAAFPFQLSFLDGSNMKAKSGSIENEVNYTRSASGAVIRFNTGSVYFMAVITTGSVIKGGNNLSSLGELTKQ